jgi:hypothetical protein
MLNQSADIRAPMTIHSLHDAPAPPLAAALAEFEAKFIYPLGPGRSFRISHGEDYPRFYRSMGDARCFVAERDGRVLGVVGVAIRRLTLPDGATRQAAYIGDVKTDSTVRGSSVYLRLSRAADAWVRPQVTAAFGVVMDGTPVPPGRYTGRAGIPEFTPVAAVKVWRVPTETNAPDQGRLVDDQQGRAIFASLCRGRVFSDGGAPAERSETSPVWIVDRDDLACGRLEDTRKAKRLIGSDGIEMHSAHLACFAWKTTEAASVVIQTARRHAALLGFPALFFAVSGKDTGLFETVGMPADAAIAGATIYGVGLPDSADWVINTSEI